MTNLTYPVHVEARLDAPLSRWLWLLKWLLVIPHYLVLFFCWPAFAVTSVIAFFAILFTGRYPRPLFDFNVGVLRWSWRVAYYAYGALGTDRYPPFTLHDVADYPAHLDVDYPEHLSRGLVLVKWWLLAIPHYLVLGLFFGGAGYAAQAGRDSTAGGIGLIGLLVLIAGVALLFTGRYPARLFDFVLGLDRWVLRVAGYVSLMTDRYPPFALDQGGTARVSLTEGDSGSGGDTAPPTVTASSGTLAGPRTGSTWTAGRTLSLVLGSLLAIAALGPFAAGTALVVADHGGRDADGFLVSPVTTVESAGHAVVSENIELVTSDVPSRFLPESVVGDLEIEATSTAGDEVFVGVAPTTDVDDYLGGVRRSELRDLAEDGATYEQLGSGEPASPPATTGGWVEQDSGAGTRRVIWEPEDGDWTVVVMNASGEPGVSAEVTVGAELPALRGLVIGLFVTGTVTALAACALILGAVRRAGRD
ncbi:MAG: DUF4389 domain-containing protein [Nocardioides sp.]